jgi:hypothetical protein
MVGKAVMRIKGISKIALFGLWISFLAVIVFANSYSPVYFEGDDASTIIYHLFGRNASIQQPFNPYHSGFDWLLSFLPANELILRNTAFLLSYISGMLLIYLLGYWLIRFYSESNNSAIVLAFLLPLIIPELFFQSLIVNPTNIGFTLCLIGLILAEFYLEKHRIFYLLVLPIVFLLGVPFRWSLIIFIPVIFGILLYKRTTNGVLPRFEKADLGFVISLLVSVMASFLGIWTTGHTPIQVLEIMLWGAGYNAPGPPSYSMLAANALSLFTPVLTITVLVGIIQIITKKHVGLFFLAFLSALPFFFLGLDTSLKYLITVLPVLLLVTLSGLEFFLAKKIVTLVIAILLIAPWLAGVKLFLKGTDYGPGFEINQWKDSTVEFKKIQDGLTTNPDERISINSFKIGYAGGFALPTVEGPRPLWGYAQVIFGGGWKTFFNDIVSERTKVLNLLATKDKGLLLQEKRFDAFECFLYERGYQCLKQIDVKKSHYERTYTMLSSTIKVIVPKRSATHEEMCARFESFKPDVVYTSSTHNANGIASCTSFVRVGPFTLQFVKSQSDFFLSQPDILNGQ